MDKAKLRQVMIDQQETFSKKEPLIDRDVDLEYCLKGNEIVVISGIRRCGKSSLLKLIAGKLPGNKVFIDFDDVRLSGFDISNYQDVEDLALELCGDKVSYFLDEVQNAPLWEKWVNNLYSKGAKLFVTGSNSSLLSSEISTFLTGRNKQLRLHTFSFREFLRMKGVSYDLARLSSTQNAAMSRGFNEYFQGGGFPLVIRNDDVELSGQYFDDIFTKDVINRYRIKEVKEMRELVLFLLSNVGKRYSYSTLKQVSGIKSLSTIKNYIDYLQNAFLVHKVDLFDYSVRKQKVSSSKVYAGDNSFLKTVAFNFTENLGQRLENLVFLHLARLGADVYYHSGRGECDFVTKKGLKIDQAIQVAVSLGDPRTREREVAGLLDAMRRYGLKEGRILTMEEEGVVEKRSLRIEILPVRRWLLQ